MSDSYENKQFNGPRDGGRGGFRGGRGSNNRDGGGFRIRLSDNEMRASRAIQEAFNLRSTVAVLGFAVRTLGEMLEQGKLDDLISQYKSQAPSVPSNRNQYERVANRDKNHSSQSLKANPFARPAKPETKTLETNHENTEEENMKTDLGSTEANPETTAKVDKDNTDNLNKEDDKKSNKE
ncbi:MULTISPECIES: hypothetical protein [unclassified Prochlorococcus]|uniref:hypothetical protein n=1 Tax=unclassified Prochlorococcus TaxID=2627481 RepID=UPI000533AF29|nr:MULTISPECIES: hypothetical protein [unclassified Prochlorococcus]KGG15388.1 hypothetical protein EV06_1259 [Prochlorococcus sp. MIT 0602]KGG17666.1 hypothetical protein EV07_1106 [Prochlorococcus sp. MIT 0603]